MIDIGIGTLLTFTIVTMALCAIISKVISDSSEKRKNRKQLEKDKPVTTDLKDKFN